MQEWSGDSRVTTRVGAEMISAARATLMLALIATATGPVVPAEAAWLDRVSVEKAVVRGEAAKTDARQTTVTVERGDTLRKIMARAGVLSSEAARALEAMQDLVDPKRLQIGDSVVLTLSGTASQIRLFALHVDFRPDVSLTLVRGQDGTFHAATGIKGRPSMVVETINGKVAKSVRASLVQAGVPTSLVDEVVKALDYDPGLPKRIKSGAEFQVIYERLGGTTGPKPGDRLRLRYAEFTLGTSPHRFYHYTPPTAEPKVVDETSRSLAALKFIAPLDETKINSPFGMRLHPVLRKMKMHRGVDFPAPRGTPVYAAADGVVEDMGWRGNYGNYVRIAHDARHATAYAHLDSFASEVSEGERVTQGQVIGFVGRTGLASGNHLYWEVLVDNKHVDPMMTGAAAAESGRKLEIMKSAVQKTAAQKARVVEKTRAKAISTR